MKPRTVKPGARPVPPRPRPARAWTRHAVPACVAFLLATHLGLAVWGISANSVTYDENTHVASGVAAVRYHDLWISAVNPPLVKAWMGAAAFAAGARPPAKESLGLDQFVAAESFMRANAAHYHRVFVAARLVVLLLSLALGLVTWRVASRLYGAGAGLLALALYALCPEMLAHGGLATLDVATALGMFATMLAFLRFAEHGRARDWVVLALALSFTFLTRFMALLLVPVLAALSIVALVAKRPPSPQRFVWGMGLLVPAVLVALEAGYLGQTSFRPLSALPFESHRFLALRHVLPALRLPLPDAWLAGLDHQTFESQGGITPTFLFGHITREPVWYYTPVAVAVKWPLALWGALVLAAVFAWGRRAAPDRRFEELSLLSLPVACFASAMFLVQLNVGVRYLVPALPPLFVLSSRWLAETPKAPTGRMRRGFAAALVGIALLEVLGTAPWYLSFYNRLGGGPGNGDRIVNDSNVDVGQGLIALRDAMKRLGIARIHLAYHGTTDPALYGIDYVPYLGGSPGEESDWIAVSSYYYVGLSQRMMTRTGRTPFVTLDFRSLWDRPETDRPARCMYLFRIRLRGAPPGRAGPG